MVQCKTCARWGPGQSESAWFNKEAERSSVQHHSSRKGFDILGCVPSGSSRCPACLLLQQLLEGMEPNHIPTGNSSCARGFSPGPSLPFWEVWGSTDTLAHMAEIPEKGFMAEMPEWCTLSMCRGRECRALCSFSLGTACAHFQWDSGLMLLWLTENSFVCGCFF